MKLSDFVGQVTSRSRDDAPARRWTGFPRNWIERLMLGIVMAIVPAYGTWVMLPRFPVYQTTAMILLRPSEPKLLPDRTDRREVAEPYERYRRTHSQLLTSEMVLKKALARPGVATASDLQYAADPVQWLQTHLDVTTSDDSYVLILSLWGLRPEGLGEILNAVHMAYFDEIVNVERNRRVERLSELERILVDKEEAIRSKRNTLKKFQGLLGEGASTSFEMLDKQKEISRLESIADWLAMEVQEIKVNLSAPTRVSLLEQATPTRPLYRRLDVPIAIAVGLVCLLLTQIVLWRWK